MNFWLFFHFLKTIKKIVLFFTKNFNSFQLKCTYCVDFDNYNKIFTSQLFLKFMLIYYIIFKVEF